MKIFVRNVLMICALAFLLLWTPLWNGYPFLHADSGTYIWSSVIFLVPQDRPIGYSLFLRATQLFPSLWMVVIVQALGTAYLLWRVAERMLISEGLNNSTRAWLALMIATLTILFTTISTFVGFILADILASWIFLGTTLWFLSTRNFDRVLAALAIFAGAWSHNSHVLLALGLAVPVMASCLLLRRSRPELLRRALLWFAVVVIALTAMFAVNIYLRAGTQLTRGGDTIWLNRFAGNGVLQATLETNCATQTWKLCASLPELRAHQGEVNWFLFGQNSPVNQVGWEKETREQNEIVMRALQCCAAKIIESSVSETWRQFWLLSIQPYLAPLSETMNAVLAVRKNFPHELNIFRTARQQAGQFTPTRLIPLDETWMQIIFLILGIGLALNAGLRRAWRECLFLGGVLYFLILNAAIMATFSGAFTRYQGRVYWLLIYAVLVVLTCQIVNRRGLFSRLPYAHRR